MSARSLEILLTDVRACRACEPHLPLGPRPVVQVGATARILVVGQAPGAKVHASGIPWDDKSGERLRDWMDVDSETFYDKSRIAILPMGYCYPGKAASGDLPPRRECADLWLDLLLAELPRVELTLLIGQYAQAYFLRDRGDEKAHGRTEVFYSSSGRRGQRRLRGVHESVTTTTRGWRAHAPGVIPLPHPSPRNVAWFMANPWFDDELLPVLRRNVRNLVAA
ncbi:MAG: uracil-DNA glycosylase family protein [Ramlibacter sp.]|nr:uracil-DNA glycosylase family protein [Ramlibacter sp.]